MGEQRTAGKIRASIVVCYNKNGQILLLKRPSDHLKFPNQWCFPGGKNDYISEFIGELPSLVSRNLPTPHQLAFDDRWESYAEAAIAELKEETGIRLRFFEELNLWLADDEFLVKPIINLKLVTDDEITKTFPNGEHVDCGWFNFNSFQNIRTLAGLMTSDMFDWAWENRKNYVSTTPFR